MIMLPESNVRMCERPDGRFAVWVDDNGGQARDSLKVFWSPLCAGEYARELRLAERDQRLAGSRISADFDRAITRLEAMVERYGRSSAAITANMKSVQS